MDDRDGQRQIHMSEFDLERLRELIEEARTRKTRDAKHLKELDYELSRAVVVNSKDIPSDVVTMNSRIVLEDLDTGEAMTFTLSFPAEADADDGKVSVLAPVGTAVIGYRVGDVVEWEVPAGIRRLTIKEMLYQPESAGDYHL